MNLEEKVARLQQLSDDAPTQRSDGKFATWRNETSMVLRYFLGEGNDFYQRFQRLRFTAPVRDNCRSAARDQVAFTSGMTGAKNLLHAAIGELKLMDDLGTDRRQHNGRMGDEIFVVHGHNEALRHSVVGFLCKITGTEPTVLQDEPNMGMTLFEKFEDAAGRASFAVVLATADDIGRAKAAKDVNDRARQNVILEWGFFAGRLGRHRVALLCEQDVELPSDTSGLVYIPLDRAGSWRIGLARELKAAGITVSLDKAL